MIQICKMKFRNCFLTCLALIISTVLIVSQRVDAQVATWSFQLEGDPIVLTGKNYHIVDLNFCSDYDMGRLKVIGSKAIAYTSAHWEEWRPDKDEFPAAAMGKKIYDGGENYIDTSNATIRALMKKRMELAKQRGFHGIVFDNVDFTGKDTGFKSDRAAVLDYQQFLAKTAHGLGLKFALKNAADYLPEIGKLADLFVVAEGISNQSLKKYASLGKPVFNYETESGKKAAAKDYPFAYSILKPGGDIKAEEKVLSDNGAALLKIRQEPGEVVSWSIQYLNSIVPLNKDYHVVDMFDVSDYDLGKLRAQGTKTIAYFSSQYENWRTDSHRFPKQDIGLNLDSWDGECWINPKSQAIRAIMIDRMKMAKRRGFHGIDVDNVDFYRFKTGFDNSEAASEDYIRFFIAEAKKLGLKFSLKNATELAYKLRNDVDFYQNEEGIEYNELHKYIGVGKPVFNIEYKKPKEHAFFPGIYSIYKNDVDKMDSREVIFYPKAK